MDEQTPIELVVAADDRTGALETAGACADAGLAPVTVLSRSPATGDGRPSGPVVVVDIATRHLDEPAARRRSLEAVGSIDAPAYAHKIDSALRGNWAAQVVESTDAFGWRALVVPALPAAGRTCAGGVVVEGGRPIGEGPAGLDARRPVRSSRPADHLLAAGASLVIEVHGAVELEAWLAGGEHGVAVCDAATDVDLAAIGAVWASAVEVLLASTAAGVAAAARSRVTPASSFAAPASLPRPVLVVCGSLHRAARRQLDALAATGVAVVDAGGGATVLSAALAEHGVAAFVSPVRDVQPVGDEDARAMIETLVSETEGVRTMIEIGTLVLIGGDTAAGVLGDDVLHVGGTVAPGVPWSTRSDGAGPLIVSRSGGFGDDAALVDLLRARMAP